MESRDRAIWILVLHVLGVASRNGLDALPMERVEDRMRATWQGVRTTWLKALDGGDHGRNEKLEVVFWGTECPKG